MVSCSEPLGERRLFGTGVVPAGGVFFCIKINVSVNIHESGHNLRRRNRRKFVQNPMFMRVRGMLGMVSTIRKTIILRNVCPKFGHNLRFKTK